MERPARLRLAGSDATGFNAAEARTAGSPEPRALPVQILDMPTGLLMAFGTAAALTRQRREGGSWHVRLSLAHTGQLLRGLGRVSDGFAPLLLDLTDAMETSESGYGRLEAMQHAAELSHTVAVLEPPADAAALGIPLAWR